MAARKPEPPFAWLVAATVPDWAQIGPPTNLCDGPGRAIVELDGRGRSTILRMEAGKDPERLTIHTRMAAMVELLGPNRSDLTLAQIHRDEYFGRALGLVVGDADPTHSAANVAWDAPAWFGALRDGGAWANVRSATHLLPTLGDFYPKGPPTQVRAALGDGWANAAFGIVLLELPSLTAHARLATRGRVVADLAVFESWARRGKRPPGVLIDL